MFPQSGEVQGKEWLLNVELSTAVCRLQNDFKTMASSVQISLKTSRTRIYLFFVKILLSHVHFKHLLKIEFKYS